MVQVGEFHDFIISPRNSYSKKTFIIEVYNSNRQTCRRIVCSGKYLHIWGHAEKRSNWLVVMNWMTGEAELTIPTGIHVDS